jgi:hypothetical protein
MLVLGQKEEELEKEIETYCRIALANGSMLTVDQLAQLIDVDASRPEIEETIRSSPLLRSKLLLRSGYVMERSQDAAPEQIQAEIEEELENHKRAVENLKTARTFALSLSARSTMTAVGGTNSYLSAREKDDIDLFCIAKKDTMWILMLESLARARIFGLTHKGTPPICLSFVMDERWAADEFGKPRDAMFARDLLTSKVISGRGVYNEFIRKAGWMESLFPRLYSAKLSKKPEGPEASKKGPTSVLTRVANRYLFATVGRYIVLKAWLLNRRFAKEGRIEHVFATDIGKDHLIYESNRYRMIRKMYDSLRSS